MDKTALLIVDMQTGFGTAKSTQTIRNCITEIIKAKKVNMPIIVLEYNDSGRTLSRLRRHLDDYDLVRFETKYNDGGGKEVVDCCLMNDWEIETFIVCGVNIGACVALTIKGLIRYDKNVKVVKLACNGNANTRRQDFNGSNKSIFQSKNVEIV